MIAFFTGPLLDQTSTDSTTDQSITLQTGEKNASREPTVLAPIGRLYGVPVYGGGSGILVGDLGGSVPEVPLDSSDALHQRNNANNQGKAVDIANPSEIEGYQGAVGEVQKFVGAYTTYSPVGQSASQWVDSIPSASESTRSQILEQAEGVWPELAERQVSTVGSVVNESITPVYVDSDATLMQIRVRVTQDYSVEGKSAVRSLGYAVTIKKVDNSGWEVVAIRGG